MGLAAGTVHKLIAQAAKDARVIVPDISYDPFQIVEQTKGRVYEDGQWLDRKDAAFGERLDAILKEVTKEEERRKRLLELITDSGAQNEDGRAHNGHV